MKKINHDLTNPIVRKRLHCKYLAKDKLRYRKIF